jgi:hypothetical protein
VSVMNIHRNFHRTSDIFGPLCHSRHEYLASGIFLDWEHALLPRLFDEIEAAARYVRNRFSYLPIAHSNHQGIMR